ncbi:YceD family protein [Desulfuribacillus alkaliarsenatis]|uniref:Metal-binding protein n=1 Tax=Desulfuribacillus alkaliarsenatis TaxID=766136 RepID=A0A1E5G5W9_9FIRM|nr:DUF177 domain-containing protein [Desulfuribacillus alkaliarsenatis]OEF98553.1 hypothetical protein BHF68_02500 [Desulfuribacillus alkaliarsenatis]
MKIRIEKEYPITKDHQYIKTTIDLQELTDDSLINDITEVLVDIEVVNTKPREYQVSGSVKTTIGLICGNCLQDLQVNVNSTLDEIFVLAEMTDFESGAIEESDDKFNYIAGQVIDLKPFIKQEILLSLPMKPLCKEVCKGLCPKCGVNRNIESCDCNTQRIDPRLADLADFFKK